MLDTITYGTFLVFGCACIVMVIYAIMCVPETKGMPLESIYMLFEGNIIAGATRDTIPRYSRAKHLGHRDADEQRFRDEEDDITVGKNDSISSHVERVNPTAKNTAYGMNNASAS